MYDDFVELMYNEKFSLLTNKMVNDIITDYIFNNMNANFRLLYNLYNVLKNIFYKDKLIVKGGIASQLITQIDNYNIRGDLDISINIEPNKFNKIILDNIKNKNKKTYKITDIFEYINDEKLINDISQIMENYKIEFEQISDNIDFNNMVPISSKYNNNIYIAGAYNKVYNVISNIKYGKFNNNLKFNVNIVDNKFILIRFYYTIKFACNLKKHYDTFVIEKDKYKCKFLFLDISITPLKTNNINNIEINTFLLDNKYNVINDQIQTLFHSFLLKHKIKKRVNRFIILFNKYKNELTQNSNQNRRYIDNKILYSRIKYIFNDENILYNYYFFKDLISNDKLIYLINNISVFELKDVNIINVKPKKYIRKQLRKAIKIIDAIINSNLQAGNNDKEYEYDENILHLIANEFNLSNNECENIKYNKDLYKSYVKLYHNIYI
ncbi:hypothetical protein MseVgp019 [Melanoplus sanguinipes entomopoxvirus]|uniref:Uncharacterized protein n=1 Tax=Melanoplus sanguinipes entomopoxvirus TaxID=83191 RepID=Q9YW73_MSEPV|nr:hypothetical protein MseVgp019 [Melanoplus sanguinipes entomopoxvirus]AAC97851.1 ORF MSV019 hypothetical protein [Melanoplus sanguinipes entomopoxvirus 'O']